MAKPGPKGKVARNQAIRHIRETQLDLSLREIGEMFGGISAQRVHQITSPAKRAKE